ncbi:MAG: TlpA family protein disulfide reductase [Alphaproteobacteria bacterium]|nr:TlpA family protein disulfide reductase [Alphaproteobacteria bacterium]
MAVLGPAGAGAMSIVREAGQAPLVIAYADESGRAQRLEPDGSALTVLHFWASWCIPCLKELPVLDAMADEWKGKGVRVIALSMDGDDMDTAAQFFKDRGIRNLTLNIDSNNEAMRLLHVHALPATIFLNAGGEEVARADGPVKWREEAARAFIAPYLRTAR